MQYGLCTLSIVPARKEPASTSEMVTQLLFGEHYSVTGSADGWLKIKTAYDEYECWINERQHTRINEQAFKALQHQEIHCTNEIVQVIQNKTQATTFPITIGATLPLLKNHHVKAGDQEFVFDGHAVAVSKKQSAEKILETAYMFLNAPYLWGGKSPFGIDCSGFTQLVYKLNGYKLPRDSDQQVEMGTPLSFVDEAEPGDIAFFDNEAGKIVHVGILLNNEKIIHASGYVRIDRFDHYGIHNSEVKGYTHHLRVIKRIL
jgi:cell wall-associated NlpC family hydrolase